MGRFSAITYSNKKTSAITCEGLFIGVDEDITTY